MNSHLDETVTWANFNEIDRRLLKALSKLGFTYPTLVQSKCIPLALLGKDVLVRARTGMGKTFAFSIPLLHKLLTAKEQGDEDDEAKVRAVVLVPTKELCRQIEKAMTELIYYCRDSVSLVALTGDSSSSSKSKKKSADESSMQQFHLQSKPDILITTPAILVQELQAGTVDLSSVKTLVIDEADLVLSYGYSNDVNTITLKMPKIFQGFLMSATLSPELEKFKKVVLHNPVVLKLEESQSQGHLQQFYLETNEADKFLTLFVFIKLGLMQGKGLIFVNDINKSYRLKLFLQQFFINAAVLNSQVPLNSRINILEQFDRGVFDYLIATDASLDQGGEDEDEDKDEDEDGEENAEAAGSQSDDDEKSGEDGSEDDDDEEFEKSEDEFDEDEEEEGSNSDGSDSEKGSDEDEEKDDEFEYDYEEKDQPTTAKDGQKKEKKENKDSKKKETDEEEYGVSRGIDFNSVSFVINFDFPQTMANYTHRIGRTARAGTTGTALSFVGVADASATKQEKENAERDFTNLHEVRLQQPRLSDIDSESILASMSSVQDQAFANSDNDELRKQPSPLLFNLKELDGFRYRVEDTMRAITDQAVKDFRSAELKQEIMNSTKLKSFFAANPNELKALRHDKAAQNTIHQKQHLNNVPDYLIPASMRGVSQANSNKKRKRHQSQTQSQRVQQSKSKDPLMALDTDASRKQIDIPRMYTAGEAGALGKNESTSGRQKWQQKHGKGKFNKKEAKKNPQRLKGAFVKSKAYK